MPAVLAQKFGSETSYLSVQNASKNGFAILDLYAFWELPLLWYFFNRKKTVITSKKFVYSAPNKVRVIWEL